MTTRIVWWLCTVHPCVNNEVYTTLQVRNLSDWTASRGHLRVSQNTATPSKRLSVLVPFWKNSYATRMCIVRRSILSSLLSFVSPVAQKIKDISDNTKGLSTRSACADAAGVVCRGEVTADCSVYGPSVCIGCSLCSAFLVNIVEDIRKTTNMYRAGMDCLFAAS